MDEIHKFAPSELICNEALEMSGLDIGELKERCHFGRDPLWKTGSFPTIPAAGS